MTARNESGDQRSFSERVVGALRLDASLYAEVHADPRALVQAASVVALGGLARGVGAFATEGWIGLVGSVLGSALIWFAATAVVAAVGVRFFHGRSSFDELLRTLGFAAAPLGLLVLGVLPLGPLRTPLSILSHAWAVATLVIAVRESLGVDTRRALLVCATALGVGLGLLLVLGLVLFGGAVFSSSPSA